MLYCIRTFWTSLFGVEVASKPWFETCSKQCFVQVYYLNIALYQAYYLVQIRIELHNALFITPQHPMCPMMSSINSRYFT